MLLFPAIIIFIFFWGFGVCMNISFFRAPMSSSILKQVTGWFLNPVTLIACFQHQRSRHMKFSALIVFVKKRRASVANNLMLFLFLSNTNNFCFVAYIYNAELYSVYTLYYNISIMYCRQRLYYNIYIYMWETSVLKQAGAASWTELFREMQNANDCIHIENFSWWLRQRMLQMNT